MHLDVAHGAPLPGDFSSQRLNERRELLRVCGAREIPVGESSRPTDRDRGIPTDQDRDVPVHRSRAAGCGLEIHKLTVKLRMGPSPKSPHGGDILVVARAASRPRYAESLKFFLQPTHAEAQFNSAPRQPVQGREFFGEHHRIALRNDQNTGSQTNRWRRRRHIGEPDQRVGNRRVGFPGHFSIRRIGISRFDPGRADHVFAPPNGVKADLLRGSANLQSRFRIRPHTARKSQTELHRLYFFLF